MSYPWWNGLSFNQMWWRGFERGVIVALVVILACYLGGRLVDRLMRGE
jgi:uncharacterized membrane protein